MRQLRREERGFTLVELLVATAIGLALIGVTVALVISALQSEPRSSSRSTQIEAGRVMLERITRQLREGCKVVGDGAVGNGFRKLAVYMNCDAGPTTIYDCGTATGDDQCFRQDVASGKSELMVSGLEVDPNGVWPVFVISNDNYVEIHLRFPRDEAGGGESVTLSDGVAMRNQPPAET